MAVAAAVSIRYRPLFRGIRFDLRVTSQLFLMAAVQGLLALAMLSLMLTTSAANGAESRNSTAHGSSSSSLVSCAPDIIDAEAYKTEHPICARLAAEHQHNVQRPRCVSVLRRPVNITFHWDRDPSRAASALLAAVLRHVLGFQRVHVAPQKMLLEELQRPDELVISLAAEAGTELSDTLTAYGSTHVPTGRRVHAWLTPAARGNSACHSADWTFYSNLTALSLCGFIDPLPDSYYVSMDAVEVFGVGHDCNATMQRLLQRAKAAGSPARAIFINRTNLQREMLTSAYSFLFLDFDIWAGEPSVHVVQPPRCAAGIDDCQSELEYSDGMLIADFEIPYHNNQLYKFVENFKPTPDSLRKVLEKEANGVNLEEAACEWAQNYKSYISQELLQSVENVSLAKPYNSKHIRILSLPFIAIYLCSGDPDAHSYDNIIRYVGKQIHDVLRFYFSFVRYYVNCSDPGHMSKRLDGLLQGPRALNLLGVVSLAEEDAAAASEAAAAHRVPLLLARAVPDQAARGASTWRTAGRLRHIGLALQNFVAESGWTRVAVLSQPSKFARHYFAALQDKAKFFLRNFDLPLDLTKQIAKKALQDLKDTKIRVVLVNTDSEAAALILSTAVKLNMGYMDGFIWILREPQIRPENGTIYFTVSLSNQVKEGMSTKQLKMLRSDGDRLFVPPHSVALADALVTLTIGCYNVLVQNPNLQNDLHSDKMIRAFELSLEQEPVAGFDGVERRYKDRAVEEAYVYVDSWCGSLCKPQRLATWRVNATSSTVRDVDGSEPTLNLDFSPTQVPESFSCGVQSGGGGSGGGNGGNGSADSGSVGADSSQQHITPTDKPANTSNPAFIVHQWIESITKIETANPKSDPSMYDLLNFHKFNQFKQFNTLN